MLDRRLREPFEFVERRHDDPTGFDARIADLHRLVRGATDQASDVAHEAQRFGGQRRVGGTPLDGRWAPTQPDWGYDRVVGLEVSHELVLADAALGRERPEPIVARLDPAFPLGKIGRVRPEVAQRDERLATQRPVGVCTRGVPSGSPRVPRRRTHQRERGIERGQEGELFRGVVEIEVDVRAGTLGRGRETRTVDPFEELPPIGDRRRCRRGERRSERYEPLAVGGGRIEHRPERRPERAPELVDIFERRRVHLDQRGDELGFDVVVYRERSPVTQRSRRIDHPVLGFDSYLHEQHLRARATRATASRRHVRA